MAAPPGEREQHTLSMANRHDLILVALGRSEVALRCRSRPVPNDRAGSHDAVGVRSSSRSLKAFRAGRLLHFAEWFGKKSDPHHKQA